MRVVTDITGNKYNKLTAIECIGREEFNYQSGKTTRQLWRCRCDCGEYVNVNRNALLSGNKKSCGCLFKKMYNDNRALYTGVGIAWNALEKGEAAWNSYISSYKEKAKNRNIVWNLTREEFKALALSNCKYCGIEPYKLYPTNITHRRTRLNGQIIVNGIDRADNSIGYFYENCVGCCKRCNQAKMDMSLEEWKGWIDRIVKFNG